MIFGVLHVRKGKTGLSENCIIYGPLLLHVLGDIGGTMGLFLGASIITVCEIFDFLTLKFLACWYNRRASQPEKNTVSNGDEFDPYSVAGTPVSWYSDSKKAEPPEYAHSPPPIAD